MSGYMKCTDPDNPNKYILLTEGDIRFYEDVGGVPTPAAALTQINIYDITSGGSLTPGQRYTGDPEPPQVYLEPKRLRTFDYGGLAMDQRIEIDAPTVVHSPSTGKCQITVNGGLRAAAGSAVAVAPLSAYRTNTDELNPAWVVPVSGISGATVYGIVSNWFWTSGTYDNYGIRYTLNAGIGATSAGADYWGAAGSGSFSDGATHFVQASVSGTSGNYLYISANIASNGVRFRSGGEQFDPDPRIDMLGARCLAGSRILSNNDVFSAVIVGR